MNGQPANNLNVLGMHFDPHAIPVSFDKEAFHAARGANKGVNYLYADGHIKNLLTIEGIDSEAMRRKRMIGDLRMMTIRRTSEPERLWDSAPP